MAQSLSDIPCISDLNLETKNLLAQVENGHTDALVMLNAYSTDLSLIKTLSDAQRIVASKYGYATWPELVDAAEFKEDIAKSREEQARLLIELGCVQYNGNDKKRHYERAQKMLTTSPKLSKFSFYTALVTSNAQVVSKYLCDKPELIDKVGGPLGWSPLLYVLYSRISEPEGARQSIDIATQLLDHGANPNAHIILNDTYRFTALTGAMGEGEQGTHQPPHQYADDMVRLLLDRGAHPNEGQGLYNTQFTTSVDHWLPILLEHGLNADDPLSWDNTVDGAQVSTLDFLLASAVQGNHEARVKTLLNAGANPNAINTYNQRAVHTNARLLGLNGIAEQLEGKGAQAEELDLNDQFRLSCVCEDLEAMKTSLALHPALTQDATLLHHAADYSSIDTVEFLINQGFDIDGSTENGRTLLHQLALANDASKIKRIIQLGAKTELLDSSYQSNAAGFAAHTGSYEAMFALLDSSNSLLDVVCCAYLARAKALLEEQPSSLYNMTAQGNTALHVVGYWLQDVPHYDEYNSFVKWLVQSGADISAVNAAGQTPIEFNVANGFDTLADVLREYL